MVGRKKRKKKMMMMGRRRRRETKEYRKYCCLASSRRVRRCRCQARRRTPRLKREKRGRREGEEREARATYLSPFSSAQSSNSQRVIGLPPVSTTASHVTTSSPVDGTAPRSAESEGTEKVCRGAGGRGGAVA